MLASNSFVLAKLNRNLWPNIKTDKIKQFSRNTNTRINESKVLPLTTNDNTNATERQNKQDYLIDVSPKE